VVRDAPIMELAIRAAVMDVAWPRGPRRQATEVQSPAMRSLVSCPLIDLNPKGYES